MDGDWVKYMKNKNSIWTKIELHEPDNDAKVLEWIEKVVYSLDNMHVFYWNEKQFIKMKNL